MMRFIEWTPTAAVLARWVNVFVDGQPRAAGMSATPTFALAASWAACNPGAEIRVVEFTNIVAVAVGVAV